MDPDDIVGVSVTNWHHMLERSIRHAWKSDLFTRADAHQIPPTHFRSTTSRNNDLLQCVPVMTVLPQGILERIGSSTDRWLMNSM